MNNKLALNCLVKVFKELDMFDKKVLSLVTECCPTIEEFIGSINDVAEYGCSTGVASAFIYTLDNKKFFKDNLDTILDILDDIDYVSWMKKDDMLNVDYMVWVAVEEVCRKFMDRYNELYEEEYDGE